MKKQTVAEDANRLEGLACSGVEALIERLRDQGVEAGRSQAEQLLNEARQHAAKIEREAELKARKIVEQAVEKADALKLGGKEALKVAMRDTLLALRAELMKTVSDNVRRLITTEMDKDDFLRQLILEVAGQARDSAGVDRGEQVKVLIPRTLVGMEDLRHNPLRLHEGGMTHFVLNVAGEALAEGVSIGVSDDPDQHGIRLFLEDKQVSIDLTDKAVAEILLAHLQPRFRAVLEGTVK
jgi:V/A-type H+-transporting ATPase subunit E